MPNYGRWPNTSIANVVSRVNRCCGKHKCEGGKKCLWSADWTASNIATFADAVFVAVGNVVEKNGRFTTRNLASALGLNDCTIRTILNTDLGLGQCNCPHCRRLQELIRRQSHPADGGPALFAGFCPHVYFFCFQSWRSSWLASHWPRRASRRPGEGSAELCRRVPPLVRAGPNVRAYGGGYVKKS